MICPEYLTAGLEKAFQKIQHERMADVPILNLELEVKAVGFVDWDDYCLGVLITPWFMNLMLLPQEQDQWADLPPGAKVTHAFPSGNYEFILGEETGIGRYLMCSLFSPVFEFKSQELAILTAEAVMQGLMDETNKDEVSTRESEIQRIWNGEEATAEDEVNAEQPEQKPPMLKERIEQPMSRRDLLRGAFLREDN